MTKSGDNSLHQGHRQRLKERFLEQGLDGFTEIQVLELMLFFVIPKRDTNVIAHSLLERYGSLHRVLDAPVRELIEVDGIGMQAATLLKLVTQASRRYEISRVKDMKILDTMELCADYLRPRFIGCRDEMVYMLCLDAKCMLIGCYEVSRGSVNTAGVPVRRILEIALDVKASSVVIAHNHPSGIAVPSADDVATTRKVAMALDAAGIYLADHLVFANDEHGYDYVSLLDSNLYRPEECRAPI